MARGRFSDWVVRPVVEAARPRPEDCTSEDPTAEDCTPEDCTCEGCTAQVCPPEDCTSEDNTSEDRSAEDCTADDCSSEEAGPSPDRWTVHGCSGPAYVTGHPSAMLPTPSERRPTHRGFWGPFICFPMEGRGPLRTFVENSSSSIQQSMGSAR